MNIKIEKTPLKQGQVRIISSKSDGHRSLIATALAEEESVLFVDGWSEDMEATARCLQSLGAEIEREPSGIYVMPIGCPLPCPVDRIGQGIGQADGQLCILDCGESGSSLRFLSIKRAGNRFVAARWKVYRDKIICYCPLCTS